MDEAWSDKNAIMFNSLLLTQFYCLLYVLRMFNLLLLSSISTVCLRTEVSHFSYFEISFAGSLQSETVNIQRVILRDLKVKFM